eukprot:357621-Prorocentrum_minimum.AAC.1
MGGLERSRTSYLAPNSIPGNARAIAGGSDEKTFIAERVGARGDRAAAVGRGGQPLEWLPSRAGGRYRHAG